MGLKAAHPGTGIEFAPPADWQVEVSGTDLVVAIEDPRVTGCLDTADKPGTGDGHGTGVGHRSGPRPPPATRFRANLVLTVADNADLTFGQWQRASDDAMPVLLNGYQLLDVQRIRVAGHPGGRRLARHLSAAGDVLVMQQWFTTRGDLGVTLTATCDVGSYRLLLPQMRVAASSLALPLPLPQTVHAPS